MVRGQGLSPVGFFRLQEHGTTVAREVRAGLVTFLTMAYILFVNPQILSETGMPARDVAVATALAAALGSAVMGLWARYPFALAPGMGLNAYFAFGVVGALGISWQVGLTAVFLEGVLFVLLAGAGVRRAVLNAVPMSVKRAAMVGIGLFLAFVGLRNGGWVVDDPATLVALGDPSSVEALTAIGCLLVMVALTLRKVPGAILVGVVLGSGVLWAGGQAPLPEALWSLQVFPQETLLALDLSAVWTRDLLGAILAL
ncbi:MAG: NCS2 family permease, partial [Acidobacteriota bacterium]|nr:NCS2 family permease [Acidobacteriota bacterium]